jgi:hypothetical protein
MNDVLGEDHEEDEQDNEREPNREGQTTESSNHSCARSRELQCHFAAFGGFRFSQRDNS